MATIKPFRAWKLNARGKLAIKDFICEGESKEGLTNSDPHISSLIDAGIEESIFRLNEWKNNKVIVQDHLPSLYAYSIKFNYENKERKLTGFICLIEVERWESGKILRHENVFRERVIELTNYLEKTGIQTTPSHGLYTDEDKIAEAILEDSLQIPMLKFLDQEGNEHSLGQVQDLHQIQKIVELIRNKTIILADGHHRYHAFLELWEKSKSANSKRDHLIFLTNTFKNDVLILPYHRFCYNLNGKTEDEFVEKLKSYFWVEIVEDPLELEKIEEFNIPFVFGIVLENSYLIIKLKEGLEKEIDWKFPESVKKLDLTVLHYFVFEKCLNIKGKDQKDSKNINFSPNFTNIVKTVLGGKAALGIITRAVDIETIRTVCESGYTLPQKATWFYPKVPTGLVIESGKERN